MITTIAAFLLDTIFGDPHTKWHPVALIGSLIGWLNRAFYKESAGNGLKLIWGAIVVAIVLLVVYDIVYGLITVAMHFGSVYVVDAIQAIVLFFCICPRSLASAGREIRRYLQHGHIHLARTRVGWIVGRDTDQLDEPEIVRATVETIAENTIDGIVSPLFFFAIGGAPLAAVYRAANTLDSMMGYKNERYLYFGRPAARLDDVLNFIPARITGVLFVIMAMLMRYHGHRAWTTLRRDASKHPSPNGGWAEAPVAGALGVRLGGHNSYFGVDTFRAYMGKVIEPLAPHHIQEATFLMYGVTIAAVALTAFFRLWVYGLWS